MRSDLVDLAKLDPRIKLDIRYATTNNFLSTPCLSPKLNPSQTLPENVRCFLCVAGPLIISCASSTAASSSMSAAVYRLENRFRR